MRIYYIFLEGIPLPDNSERKECAGGYINCWVNAEDEASAKDKAIAYIHDEEGWQVLNIEEICIADRERYLEEPASLECFDQAVDYGIGAAFYIWPAGSEGH